MDATTGTPWALKTISGRKLEYEVTNAWALPTRLCQPVGNFPLWIQWKFPCVAKEPGLNPGGRQPRPPLYPLSHLRQGYGAQETTGPHKAT